MKLPLLLLSSLASACLAKNVANTGFHSLTFDVTRGNTLQDSSANKAPAFIKREQPDGTHTIELENQSTFYSVTLEVGSQGDKVIVLVDTGSSDLWVSSSSNPYCESSSSSSSRKYRRLDDKAAAIEILGKSNYDEIISKKAGSKFREINDSDAYAKIFGSGDEKEEAANDDDDDDSKDVLASKTINKAVSSRSASSSIATIDCSKYGTFDYTQSTSFKSNDTEFYILYGDSTFALGNWGYDTVKVGNLTVDNLSFAVANQSNSSMGVLGIGLEGLETTNTGALVNGDGYTYSNFPAKLVEDGLINKKAYSLWLNSWEESTGSVLFGGVDHAKYSGDLTLLPVLNTLSSYGYDNPVKLQVTLSSLSLTSDSQKESITSSSYPALLDSGTTLTYLPDDIVASIADAIGAVYSSSYGYYMLDCPSSSNSVNFTYTFQGVDIQVPLTDVVLSADTAGTTCVLAMISSDEVILGDSFLRSAYVVYDLDNYQVALAQAAFTDDEDIEAITSTIPGATSAASYYYTYGASGIPTGSVSLGVSDVGTSGVTSIDISGSTASTGSVSTRRSSNGGRSSSGSSATASSTSSSSSSDRSSAGVLNVNAPSLLSLSCIFGVVTGLIIIAI